MVDNVSKVWLLVQLVFKLWGKEIFAWLEAQAKRSDTSLDDFVVEGLKRWLLPKMDEK